MKLDYHNHYVMHIANTSTGRTPPQGSVTRTLLGITSLCPWKRRLTLFSFLVLCMYLLCVYEIQAQEFVSRRHKLEKQNKLEANMPMSAFSKVQSD